MRVTFFLLLCLLVIVSAARNQKKKGPKAVVKKIIPEEGLTFTAGQLQNVSLDVKITFQKPFKGGTVGGNNLWEVSVWLSRLKSGKTDRLGIREGQQLTDDHLAQTVNTRDTALTFEDIPIIADLRGMDCRRINFICASFVSRSPAIKGKANNVGCSSINCQACGSDFCTTEYDPVCGSDGQTYSNMCQFENAVCENPELVLANHGECEPECGSDFCTTEYDPVCGSDGQTYSNMCQFQNAVCENPELVLANHGECEPECGSDECATDYTPVCGSDGQTYNNLCHLTNAACDNPDLTLEHEGECKPECGSDVCSLDYTPVCGSDGQTYNNLCHLTNAACDTPDLVVEYEGECKPECGSDICSLDYTPVCGSDGQTYNNLCHLSNAACDAPDLVVEREGECEPECGSDVCSLDYTPVCGSDGQTYNNLCHLTNAACDALELVVEHEGECEPECGSDFCTLDYTPVCGSDGQTYSNMCFLVNAACDAPELELEYEGECKPKCGSDFCTADYNPVCGSDGQTYSNLCQFENAVCENPELVLASSGECEPECGTDVCPAVYDPVCSSDGQTYSNVCHFNNALCDDPDLLIMHQGECQPQCTSHCSEEYQPVCGSDGFTYSNPCIFSNTVCEFPDLTLEHEGECIPECRPHTCSKEYQPVCGSDGQTYNNMCDFNNAQCANSDLTLSSEGECEQDVQCITSFCTTEYQPVCGSDGETYHNLCELSNAILCDKPDLTVAHEGECIPARCAESVCTDHYDPVCGSDGNTYSNMCVFNFTATCGDQRGITLAYKGECVIPEPMVDCNRRVCATDLPQVCGSDGKTYINSCFLEFAAFCDDSSLSLDHEGPCEEEESRDCSSRTCSTEYSPVCGSDGHTYSNPCVFAFETFCEDSSLTMVHAGPCNRDRSALDCSSRVCTEEFAPVCGSDGQTYNNPCTFTYAAQCDVEGLTKVKDGECDAVTEFADDCDTRVCPADYTPVCGSNMVIYPNQCQFEYAVLCDDSELTKLYDGECEEEDPCEPRPSCTEEYAPLCGSDGTTYPNRCFFEVAVMCDNTELTEEREGECQVRFQQARLRITMPRGRKPIVRFDVVGAVSPESPSVQGDGLWSLAVFGARSQDGNDTDIFEYRPQVLNQEQARRKASSGKQFGIRNIRVEFPLFEAACTGFDYLCARFLPSEGADPRLGDDINILSCKRIKSPVPCS
ncbi:Serine protease inhibitor dipetalogastin [Holothuria leucospilota]|uniref:Serine protease inhibitor dipetalogastin n=1 Tax=Holothuria leucospilota TaxID=206669 RepID=A0A9Q1C0G0_HOLLE|nr:Serine protease inhibitor dipetalogastin [Holothuria leucospilota]